MRGGRKGRDTTKEYLDRRGRKKGRDTTKEYLDMEQATVRELARGGRKRKRGPASVASGSLGASDWQGACEVVGR